MANIKTKEYRPPTYLESFHGKGSTPQVYYNQLGRTDLMVSNVGLGGASFGNVYGPMEQDITNGLIKAALKSGINFIDTAPWYGQGLSEKRIGLALQDIPREVYYIGTKIGRYELDKERMFDFTRKKTLESIEKSLQLVGVKYFDLVFIHDAEFVASLGQLVNHTIPALLELKANGKIRNIGISGYSLQALKTIVEAAPLKSLDVLMTFARYTMLNQDAILYIPFFKSKGLGILNASVTSMNMLSGSTEFPSWHLALPCAKEGCKEAAVFARNNNINLASLAIEWALCTEEFDMTMLSVSNGKQLDENLITMERVRERALKGRLHEKPYVHEGIRKILSNIMVTHWENLELVTLWPHGFIQKLD